MAKSAASTSQRSPWLKEVLIPFWVLQILAMAIVIALLAIGYDLRSRSTITIGGFAILMLWYCICVILDIVEIILFSCHKLRPVTYLIFNVVNMAGWLVILFLDIATLVTNNLHSGVSGYGTSSVGLITPLVINLSFLASLVYASVIYHRHRRDHSRDQIHYGSENTDIEMESAAKSQRRSLLHIDDQPASQNPSDPSLPKEPMELDPAAERDVQPPAYYLELGGQQAAVEVEGTSLNTYGGLHGGADIGRRSTGSARPRAELS